MTKMNAPLYIRKDSDGTGAYLHDCYDKHLGYIHRLADAEAIVAAVNGCAKIASMSHAAAEAQREMNGESATFDAISRIASAAA